MIHGHKKNMKCPNCGETIEVVRTRKKVRDLYVTEHPEGTCPGKYRASIFRMTIQECEAAYTKYREQLTGVINETI